MSSKAVTSTPMELTAGLNIANKYKPAASLARSFAPPPVALSTTSYIMYCVLSSCPTNPLSLVHSLQLPATIPVKEHFTSLIKFSQQPLYQRLWDVPRGAIAASNLAYYTHIYTFFQTVHYKAWVTRYLCKDAHSNCGKAKGQVVAETGLLLATCTTSLIVRMDTKADLAADSTTKGAGDLRTNASDRHESAIEKEGEVN